MESSADIDRQQIKRGRMHLLIAIALFLGFAASGFFNGLKQGQTISSLAVTLAMWALLCFFLYRGSRDAKSCLECLVTFTVVIVSIALFAWLGSWSVPEMRKHWVSPGLVGSINLLGFVSGLVYCWWALRFSKSVKAFLAFQRSKRE